MIAPSSECVCSVHSDNFEPRDLDLLPFRTKVAPKPGFGDYTSNIHRQLVTDTAVCALRSSGVDNKYGKASIRASGCGFTLN